MRLVLKFVMCALSLSVACVATVGQGPEAGQDGGQKPTPEPELDAGSEDGSDGDGDEVDAGPDGSSDDAGEPTSPTDGGDAGPVEMCDLHTLTKACWNGCHSVGLKAGGLDLASPNLADRTVDVPSRLSCGTGKLVDLAEPERSVLYVRLASSECGSSSTHRRDPVIQDCILSWIESLQEAP